MILLQGALCPKFLNCQIKSKSIAVTAVTVALQDECRRSPLYYAAAYGHLEAAKVLVSSGAGRNGLDRDGWSALHAAARHGQADLVRYQEVMQYLYWN